ncbi:VOC family protein [Paraburkholderia lacunae]|uniref:Glyoxalase n=1 Tax=Paraburkholderia lacunae TaxID=2211104 RepID=A0A370NAW7_9BURK|nr:VOC family protein [Paraburkholderia lacunae]RDK02751.1 glyoxalase [Paraburkholderia lacunae]
MHATTFDHCTIRTTDLEGTCRFYAEVLGLTVGQRPNFPFPGVWLYNAPPGEGVPLVHVIDEGAQRAGHSGADGRSNVDHIAFRVVDVNRFAAGWRRWGITPPTGRRSGQLFLRDPNGVVVEIAYGSRERAI